MRTARGAQSRWASAVLGENGGLWRPLLPFASWCRYKHPRAETVGWSLARSEGALWLTQLLEALSKVSPATVGSITWVHYWAVDTLEAALGTADVLLAAAAVGLVRNLSEERSYCQRILCSPPDSPGDPPCEPIVTAFAFCYGMVLRGGGALDHADIGRLLPAFNSLLSPLGLLRFSDAAQLMRPTSECSTPAYVRDACGCSIRDGPCILAGEPPAGLVAEKAREAGEAGFEIRPLELPVASPEDPVCRPPPLELPLGVVALQTLELWAERCAPLVVACSCSAQRPCLCTVGLHSLEPGADALCVPACLLCLMDGRRIPAAIPALVRRGLATGAHKVIVRLLLEAGPRVTSRCLPRVLLQCRWPVDLTDRICER